MISSCRSASLASDFTAMITLWRWVSASGFSPRLSSALPPRATRTRTSAPQRGDHDRLDGVHAVLGLVEHDRGVGFKDLVGDLERRHAGLVEDVLADRGVAVVEGRQAVHELHVR